MAKKDVKIMAVPGKIAHVSGDEVQVIFKKEEESESDKGEEGALPPAPKSPHQVVFGRIDENLSVAEFKDGDTIQSFFEEHELQLKEGEVILINGEPFYDVNIHLENGYSLLIVPEETEIVIFGRLGEQFKKVAIDVNETLDDLLDREGVELNSEEVIFYNGIVKDPDEDDFAEILLSKKDSVIVVPAIKVKIGIGITVIIPTQKG